MRKIVVKDLEKMGTEFTYMGEVPRVDDNLKRGDKSYKVKRVIRSISDKKFFSIPIGEGFCKMMECDEGDYYEQGEVILEVLGY